jgi:hypothetical protein
MLKTLPLPFDFDSADAPASTPAPEDASLTDPSVGEASSPSLSVSYIHPTLGPVYVAYEPYRDERGRWRSVMGELPVRWLTFSTEVDACGEGK